jgi:CRP-like cAMP-binding protein
MMKDLLNVEELQWEPLLVERGKFLIREGEVERYIYFVEKGAVRAFLISEEEEFTIRFGYTGSFITSLPSYFDGSPSPLYIQVIRKAKLLRTTRNTFENYINQDMETMHLYQETLKGLISSFLAREVDLLTQSPTLRIQRLLSRSPQVFQEVPHKYIASYLRMSPETLSRLLNS